MARKKRSKTPSGENDYIILPCNNEDLERLGWTRVAVIDQECERLKKEQSFSEKFRRNCFTNEKGCFLFGWRLW